MIINETFIWLYVTAKVGNALCILGAISAAVSTISAITIVIGLTDSSGANALVTVRRIFFATLIATFVSLSLGALLPSRSDATAYAAYIIGKDVTTSDEAKRLFEAAINYIEDNTRKEHKND